MKRETLKSIVSTLEKLVACRKMTSDGGPGSGPHAGGGSSEIHPQAALAYNFSKEADSKTPNALTAISNEKSGHLPVAKRRQTVAKALNSHSAAEMEHRAALRKTGNKEHEQHIARHASEGKKLKASAEAAGLGKIFA